MWKLRIFNRSHENKISDLQAKIDRLNNQIKQAQEEIENCKQLAREQSVPKLVIPFVPSKGQLFFGTTETGTCYPHVAGAGDLSYEKELSSRGICFATRETAILGDRKRQAEVELVIACDGLELPVNQTWTIDRSAEGEFYSKRSSTLSPYRFSSKRSCNAAIRKAGDQNLRLVFNIPLNE